MTKNTALMPFTTTNALGEVKNPARPEQTMLARIWGAFERPLTYLEEERLNWGIPTKLNHVPIIAAFVHRSRPSSSFRGYADIENWDRGSWFERQFVKLDYVELTDSSPEEVRNFFLKLGGRIEEMNEGKDLTNSFMGEDLAAANKLNNSDLPFRATITFFEALDKNGCTLIRDCAQTYDGRNAASFGMPCSDIQGATTAYNLLERLLLDKGLFTYPAPLHQSSQILITHGDDATPS